MFNDERINYELSKLKKLIIIGSMIIASIILITKIITGSAGNIPLAFYLTEVMMITSGTIILIGLSTIKGEIKDEAYYLKRSNYIDKYFKVYLYIAFISFAVVIPKTAVTESGAIFSSNLTINLSMTSALIFGYGYIRYKNIYFNYSIIEDTFKNYLKGVFKYIFKIFWYCLWYKFSSSSILYD